jgi:dihydroceramidase
MYQPPIQISLAADESPLCTFPLLYIADARDYSDPMQLVDELSMIYTTCLMAYASFSYARDTAFRVVLAISLAALAAFITLYYHYLQDPVFHQIVWGVLTLVVIARAVIAMEWTLRPSRRRTEESHRQERKAEGQELLIKEVQARHNDRDERILKEMWVLVRFCSAVFLISFMIWNLDNIYCSRLKVWRRHVGLPWGAVSEGHGYW